MYNCFCFKVRALITHKPSSMQCKSTGLPVPRVTWRKAFSKLPVKRSSIVNGNLSIRGITKADSGTYASSAKNLLGDDPAVAVVMVINRLQFMLIPLNKVSALESCKVILHCAAQGSTEIIWKRVGKHMPQNHVVYSEMAYCNYQSTSVGWREDSGLLTDKSTLPVTQIRLGDLDQSREEGYHTLGKLKCYGQA